MAKTLTPQQPFLDDSDKKRRLSWRAWSQRTRVLSVVAVVALLALIGGGYYYWAEFRPQQQQEQAAQELDEQARNAFGGEIRDLSDQEMTVLNLRFNEEKTFTFTEYTRVEQGVTHEQGGLDDLETGSQANVIYNLDTKEVISVWIPQD